MEIFSTKPDGNGITEALAQGAGGSVFPTSMNAFASILQKAGARFEGDMAALIGKTTLADSPERAAKTVAGDDHNDGWRDDPVSKQHAKDTHASDRSDDRPDAHRVDRNDDHGHERASDGNSDHNGNDHAPGLTETEKAYIQKARIGQGQFHKLLLEAFRSTCPILGISNPDLLVASHIKPWTASTNHERLDPKNGILLSPLFDKLFDRGLITFAPDGTIEPSPCLSAHDCDKCSLAQLPNVALPPDSERYMKYHRRYVFKST